MVEQKGDCMRVLQKADYLTAHQEGDFVTVQLRDGVRKCE